ncbi:MAG TPA: hypothetical protein VF846_13080 [Thermoanaerobaculia bacterium]
MRHFLAILLLLAAAVHPLAHFGDVLVTCPCVHGAVVDVAPPIVARNAATLQAYAGRLPSFLAVARASEVPARAPPAA